MKNLLSPVILSLIGYLLCVVSFFVHDGIMRDPGTWWLIGIGFHLIASFIFFRRKASLAAKFVYLLLPVPLGFFLTFFATIVSLAILS